MKRLSLPIAAALSLTACGGTPPVPEAAPLADPTPAAEAPSKPMALGFEISNLDTSVRPQDNFYSYVNGGWLAKTEIPEDKSNYGAFTELHDLSRQRLRDIIEEGITVGGPVPR